MTFSQAKSILNVGFIGAGNWAEYNHIPLLLARTDVKVVGLATPTQKSRDRVRERFGISFLTADYHDLLNEPIDAVVISSPHGFHYEQALASLQAGKHVLVEKPMTLYAREAWELVELANQKGLVLMVPTGWHYNSMVIAAREKLLAGRIGKIEYVVCHMGSALRSLYMGQSWPYTLDNIPDPKLYYSDPKISGGGQGYSQLSHSVALMLWLTGLQASEVFAYMSGPGAPVEMYDALVAKFEGGAIATISGAGTQPPSRPKHEMDLHIYGSEGELSIDLDRERLDVIRNDGENFHLDVKPGDGDYTCDGPVNRFVDLILGKSSENLSPGEIGARTIELIEAAYRSVASHQPETVR